MGSSLFGSKSRSWIKLLISVVRMADLARWKIPLDSDSTVAPAETVGGDSPKLLYFEIGVAILEFLIEEDRNARGHPVSLEGCIENILFSDELIKRHPKLKMAAPERVISALETPTLLAFQFLDDREVEQETALINKIVSRDIKKYYLTDTGRMLCGLSFRVDDLKNLDLSIQFLLRLLKDGDFKEFLTECEQKIDSIHNLSARLRKVANMPSWPNQWQNIMTERDRVKRVLEETIKLINECIDTLDTDVVQSKIQKAIEYSDAPTNLRFQIEEWLFEIAGALNGLRNNFSDLIRISERKRRNIVPSLDFFAAARGLLEKGTLSDTFVDDQIESFGLWGLHHSRVVKNPLASMSSVDFLRPIQARESRKYIEEEVLPPPPKEHRVTVFSEQDEMLRSHAKQIIGLLGDAKKLRLSEYLDMLHDNNDADSHISALFSLFIDPSPLSLFEVEVVSALVETAPSVTWTMANGRTLRFTDLEIMKRITL